MKFKQFVEDRDDGSAIQQLQQVCLELVTRYGSPFRRVIKNILANGDLQPDFQSKLAELDQLIASTKHINPDRTKLDQRGRQDGGDHDNVVVRPQSDGVSGAGGAGESGGGD